MSAIQTAAANTVLRIANLFEQNAALKHGLPKVGGPDRIGEEPVSTTEKATISRIETTTESTVKETPSPGGGATASSQSSLLRRVAPFFLTGAAAGIPSLLLLNKPVTPATTTPPPAVAPAEESKDGSLLQYLEDKGYHLPGGTEWPTNPSQPTN